MSRRDWLTVKKQSLTERLLRMSDCQLLRAHTVTVVRNNWSGSFSISILMYSFIAWIAYSVSLLTGLTSQQSSLYDSNSLHCEQEGTEPTALGYFSVTANCNSLGHTGKSNIQVQSVVQKVFFSQVYKETVINAGLKQIFFLQFLFFYNFTTV